MGFWGTMDPNYADAYASTYIVCNLISCRYDLIVEV